MKVLIGTPIHETKDYCMEKWLENVSQLEYSADLLLVDNSTSTDYIEKVKGYCAKYGITKYKIKHLEIPERQSTDRDIDEVIHERVCRSRELIRQHVLYRNYDAWFSWECDQIIPTDGLRKLVQLIEAEDLLLVDHNCWVNNIPNLVSFDFGVSLFKRKCLEKYSFLPESGSWYEAESWFRKRLLKDGCNYLEVQGIIEPIYHLDK
ncbi:hypothetical protein HYT32_01960 [Candidatus Roizmanbacteria bacterium]|nr:hypothetical protein [Candidatus Roizmanbacteria bacterium]